jgi:hypothetical protein
MSSAHASVGCPTRPSSSSTQSAPYMCSAKTNVGKPPPKPNHWRPHLWTIGGYVVYEDEYQVVAKPFSREQYLKANTR